MKTRKLAWKKGTEEMGGLFHYLMISGLTLVMSVFFSEHLFCNPLLVYVLYLGLEADFFPGLLLTLVAGCILDGLSGAPPGVFLFTFLWVFFIVRWLSGFLRGGSLLFSLLVLLSGVFLENFFTILSLGLRAEVSVRELWLDGLRILFPQMLSALIFCPVFLWFFRKMHRHFVSDAKVGKGNEVGILGVHAVKGKGSDGSRF